MNIIEFIINIYAQFYTLVQYVSIMIMRSFENQISDSITRLMPDVQYVYIQK